MHAIHAREGSKRLSGKVYMVNYRVGNILASPVVATCGEDGM